MPRAPRRRSPAATVTPAAAPPTPSVNYVIPATAPRPTPLKRLLSAHRTVTDQIGVLKESYQDVVTEVGPSLNRKAFGWLKQLDKMEAEIGYDVMSHFLYMYEVTGLKARFEAAQRLPMGDDVDTIDTIIADEVAMMATAPATETVPPAGNVRAFPAQPQAAAR